MQEVEKREGRDTMQKEEFEDLVGQALSDRDFEIIETVYLHHPAIRDVSGKEEVAELYKSFGMVIFYDLFQRAKKNQDLEDRLCHTQAEADRIKEEMVQNRASMGLDYSRMLDKSDDKETTSFTHRNGAGTKLSTPAPIRVRIKRYGIEIDGIQYNALELMMRCGQEVNVIKSDGVLHVKDMGEINIVDIKCD